MVTVYIVCVVLAGALSGVFTYQLLAGEGYIADFESGLMVAGAAACVYIGVQFLYMTLVTVFVPTRDRGAFFVESLSQAAVLLFIPYLAQWQVNWPYDFLETFAPLVYLAAFGVLHVALKFVSFFAFTSGRPAGRLPAAAWAVGCVMCAYGALAAVQAWAVTMEAARPQAAMDRSAFRIGDTFARAASVEEGALISYKLPAADGRGITMRWAVPPEDRVEFDTDTVNVVMYFEGTAEKDRIAERVQLNDDGWAEQRLLVDEIPEGATRVSMFWSMRKEPPWQRLLGFHPVVTTNRTLLLSGPYSHETRVDDDSPNVIIVSVDGLGWANMSLSGYNRETTPGLDRLASTLQYFPFTYTPAPEGPAAAMTVLTGLGPLRHDYRGGNYGAIPTTVSTLAERFREAGYTTAAFTEGESVRGEDLVHGSGYERGFESFDPSYRADASAVDLDPDSDVDPNIGSRWTLNKAMDWVNDHGNVKFMMYLRLRELSDFKLRAAYGDAFMPQEGGTPREIYDSALQYLDRQLANFVKFIRDYETRKNTVVILTGNFGYQFDGNDGQPYVALSEDCLRVPLIMFIPGNKRVERTDLVGLEDVPVAAMALAGIEAGPLLDGREFLSGPTGNEPVAVLGAPPALTIRTPQWRFAWAPPAVNAATDDGGIVELYDMTRYRPGRNLRNVASRYPAVVRRQKERLAALLANERMDNATASARN